jgi:hypothetical protein
LRAASELGTSPDRRLHPYPEKRTKGKGKKRTSDKVGLLIEKKYANRLIAHFLLRVLYYKSRDKEG